MSENTASTGFVALRKSDISSKDKQDKIFDTGVNLARTVTKLGAEVAGAFDGVPYVSAVTSIVVKIIEIQDEIKVQKKRCKELTDKILRRSERIFLGLRHIAESPSKADLGALRKDLETYNTILKEIYEGLCKFKSRSILQRVLDRGLDELEQYNRMIDGFNDDIMLGIQVELRVNIQSSLSGSVHGEVQFKPMPPAPNSMLGRELEKKAIIETLLGGLESHPHVAILGAGGIGKTTLALSVLHAPEVIAYYPHRYFISCEAVFSVRMLLSELADALEIPPSSRDAKLYQTVCHSLNVLPTLLCLDNFETPWLDAQPRRSIDDLLSHLNSLANVAIIITMRGTERPSSITWSKPLLKALQPLSLMETQQILQNVTHNSLDPENEYINKLLQVVEGVPLAATLLGHLLRDELETPESLWKRWQERHTTIIKTDDKDKLYSLDVSIQLSLDCRYMRGCPDAAKLLAMFSLLPDGFPESTSMKDDLIKHLPAGFAFLDALQTLKKVALVYIDQRLQHPRIHLLPPIQYFCYNKLSQPELVNTITTFYVDFITTHQLVTAPSNFGIVPQELPNIQSLLISALQSQPVEAIFKAATIYTEWTLFVGMPSQEVITVAIKQSTSPSILADCWYWSGRVAYYMDGLEEAEASFNSALKLYQQVHSVLGQANVLQSLGQLQMHQDKLEKAETSFNSALKLHQEAHDVLGQANDLQNLGQLHMQKDDPEKTGALFNSALELYQQGHSILGQANILQNLGELQMWQDDIEKAEASFNSALKLHQQLHFFRDQANDLWKLGKLQMRQNDLERAEVLFNSALKLHQQAHDVLGQANDLWRLGELHRLKDDLEKAETLLNSALKLYQQTHSIRGQASTLQSLGQLQVHQNELGKAEASFNSALELHQQAHSVKGQANDLWRLGELQMHQDELEKAEASFNSALKLYQQAHTTRGQANALRNLGELQMRQDELEKAEASFKSALELHQQAHDVRGQADDLTKLGEVQMHRDELEKAEASFNSALKLHQHSARAQANNLCKLGELQMHKDDLEKAETLFNSALKLHQQAHDVFGQANDLLNLGQLQMCQDELEKAESSFNSALKLHQQSHSVRGQANDLQKLGELHMCQGDLEKAGILFNSALKLHQQAHDVLGQTHDLENMNKLQMCKDELKTHG